MYPMFGKKSITVCSITRTRITMTMMTLANKELVVDKREEKACTPNMYPVFFSALRNEFGVKRVRLLIPEEDAFVKLVTFPKGTVVARSMVIEKAKEVTAEMTVDGFMDWRQVEIAGDGVGVQIYVVKKETLAPILTACQQAGVIVEACEPPSFAMARMASKVHEPFILVYPPVKPEFICAVSGGKVLEVMRVNPLESLEETKHACIAQVATMWGIPIKAIATNMPDPVVGLASKTEYTGSAMDVLESAEEEEKKVGERKRLPLPILIGGIALLVVAIGFFSISLWKGSRGKPSSTTTVASGITPSPTQMPVVRTALLVEVQNGSGEAGLAGKGKKVLEDIGYTTVTTANADNYGYQGVTVKAKTTAVGAFVLTDLKVTYPNASASSTLLDSTSPVDAVVILGK